MKTAVYYVCAAYSMLHPLWGISSVGRASALQAGGERFESVILHTLEEIIDMVGTQNEKNQAILTEKSEKNRASLMYAKGPAGALVPRKRLMR